MAGRRDETRAFIHDANNLLMVVLGNLELALAQDADAPNRRYIEHALRGSEAIQAHLRMGLDAEPDDSAEWFEVIEATQQLVAALGSITPSNVVLILDHTSDHFEVHVQKLQFEATLTNILINAIQAIGDQRGEIVIDFRPVVYREPFELASGPVLPGSYVLIEVSDDGRGMSALTLASAFRTGFSTTGGAGLGLSNCLNFVHANEAALHIESREGRGTTVSLFLKLA